MAEGKINEAENWLYEEVGQLGLPGLRVAIDFYLQLNERDDAIWRRIISHALRLRMAEKYCAAYGVVL